MGLNGTPGDFDRCRAFMRRHGVSGRMIDGACANLHKIATGEWPGRNAHKGAHALVLDYLIASMGAYEPIRWEGPLAHIEKPTGDRRQFPRDTLTYQSFPMPFRWQKQGLRGHDGAVTVGVIEGASERDVDGQRVVWAHGYFLDPNIVPEVNEAVHQAEHGVSGPSVDLDSYTAVLKKTLAGDTVADMRKGRMRAATLVSVPAFADLRIKVKRPDAIVASMESFAVNAAGWRGAPIAPREATFDADDAAKRIEAWANGDPNQMAKMFLWVDTENGPLLGRKGYRLPWGDIIDNKPYLIYHAIYAAAALLQDAHGGLPNIPDQQKGQLRTVITEIYQKLAEEFNDPSVIAPWDHHDEQQQTASGFRDPEDEYPEDNEEDEDDEFLETEEYAAYLAAYDAALEQFLGRYTEHKHPRWPGKPGGRTNPAPNPKGGEWTDVKGHGPHGQIKVGGKWIYPPKKGEKGYKNPEAAVRAKAKRGAGKHSETRVVRKAKAKPEHKEHGKPATPATREPEHHRAPVADKAAPKKTPETPEDAVKRATKHWEEMKRKYGLTSPEALEARAKMLEAERHLADKQHGPRTAPPEPTERERRILARKAGSTSRPGDAKRYNEKNPVKPEVKKPERTWAGMPTDEVIERIKRAKTREDAMDLLGHRGEKEHRKPGTIEADRQKAGREWDSHHEEKKHKAPEKPESKVQSALGALGKAKTQEEADDILRGLNEDELAQVVEGRGIKNVFHFDRNNKSQGYRDAIKNSVEKPADYASRRHRERMDVRAQGHADFIKNAKWEQHAEVQDRLSGMNRDELEGVARRLGVDHKDSDTVAHLREQIRLWHSSKTYKEKEGHKTPEPQTPQAPKATRPHKVSEAQGRFLEQFRNNETVEADENNATVRVLEREGYIEKTGRTKAPAAKKTTPAKKTAAKKTTPAKKTAPKAPEGDGEGDGGGTPIAKKTPAAKKVIKTTVAKKTPARQKTLHEYRLTDKGREHLGVGGPKEPEKPQEPPPAPKTPAKRVTRVVKKTGEPKEHKLTPAQEKALRDIEAGGKGHPGSRKVLQREGYIDEKGDLTQKARDHLGIKEPEKPITTVAKKVPEPKKPEPPKEPEKPLPKLTKAQEEGILFLAQGGSGRLVHTTGAKNLYRMGLIDEKYKLTPEGERVAAALRAKRKLAEPPPKLAPPTVSAPGTGKSPRPMPELPKLPKHERTSGPLRATKMTLREKDLAEAQRQLRNAEEHHEEWTKGWEEGLARAKATGAPWHTIKYYEDNLAESKDVVRKRREAVEGIKNRPHGPEYDTPREFPDDGRVGIPSEEEIRARTHAVTLDTPAEFQAAFRGQLEHQGRIAPRSLISLGMVGETPRRHNDVPWGKNTNAEYYFWGRHNAVNFNPQWRKNPGEVHRSQQACYNTGWYSRVEDGTDSMEATLAHEFGHHIGFRALAHDRKGELLKAIVDEYDLGVEPTRADIDGAIKAQARKIALELSEYSITNLDEFLAEIWREFSNGGTRTRPKTRRIALIMRELSEEGWA